MLTKIFSVGSEMGKFRGVRDEQRDRHLDRVPWFPYLLTAANVGHQASWIDDMPYYRQLGCCTLYRNVLITFISTTEGFVNLRYFALFLFVVLGVAGAQTSLDLTKGCSQADIAKYGHPVMFSRVNGVAFGASTERSKFQQGEPINVAVWLSNKSHRVVVTSGCSLLQDNIDAFDSTGRRLLSESEKDDIKLRQEGRPSIRVCSGTPAVMNRRHGFCGVIGGGVLNREYNMPAGTYTIRQKKTGAYTDEANAPSLSITVE
jgi:hypothetical protein